MTEKNENEKPNNYFQRPGKTYFPNPGTIKNIHRKTRDIMPEFFDGIQLFYKKSLSPSKAIYAKWILSHTTPSGFRIGGIFNWKCKDNIMETPMIEAEFNPGSLASNLSLIIHPINTIKIEANSQNINKDNYNLESDTNISIEYTGPDATLTFSTYNASINCGRFTISYLRSINNSIALGAEILFEWMKTNLLTKTALAARYSTEKSTIAATASSEGLDISYWRTIHRSIQMGSTLAFNRNNQKAIATICYQWNFEHAIVRGMVDSDCSVGVLYRRMVESVPCWLGLSVLFCIPTNRFAFGLKFDLDPSTCCRCVDKTDDDDDDGTIKLCGSKFL